MKKKHLFLLGFLSLFAVSVILVFFFLGRFILSLDVSNSENGGDNFSESVIPLGEVRRFAVEGVDNVKGGYFDIFQSEAGGYSIDYVILIEDASINNNGACIDQGVNYCNDDPGGVKTRAEEVKYHYATAFPSTLDSAYPQATTIWPVYCNWDVFLNDPSTYKTYFYRIDGNIKNEKKVDARCGTVPSNWKPTPYFVASGTGSIDDLDSFLKQETLQLHDLTGLYVVKNKEGGGVVHTTVWSSSQYPDQPLLKKYDIAIQNKGVEVSR